MSGLAIALGAAAILAAIASWLPWFRGHVNAAVFTRVLGDLLGKGEVERARKLCNAAPHSPFVHAAAAALDAARRPARDDAARARAIEDAYDQTIRAALARAAPRLYLAMGALGAAAVAVYLQVEAGAGGPAALWPAAAIVPAVHGWRMGARFARAAGTERERVVTAITTATTPASAPAAH